MSWDDYRFFLAVVRHRTLSAAARALDVTQPTVGRRIEALQSRVGALFDRDGSNLVVTPLGQEILGFVEEMERQHAAVHRCVERERVEGQASIRVTTTFGLATRWLAPLLEEFRTSAPELSFAVQTGIPLADLLHREADIAIRMGTPGDDQLVGTRVGRVGCGLYAAERYLEEHGHPTSLEALANHHIVESEGEIADLVQVRALRRFTGGAASRFAADNVSVQIAALERGVGIATIPCFMVDHLPEVRRILSDEFAVFVDLWLLVNPSIKELPNIRKAMDLLREALLRDRARFEGTA